ncbi:MAG: DUF4340 domain-containing protein [Ruminococcaceae bacterium]|nr:DUF4340 domain-containing protein [Oscillospiraceae bacterium]
MAYNVKRKKKNKYLPLAVLCVLLVLLVVAYSAMSAANKRAEAERLAAEEEANKVIMIADYDASTISSITYSKDGGEDMTFVRSGTAWSYVKDSKFPLDQTKISNMASAIASIGAVCEVDGGDTGEYGFDSPDYVIKVKYSDGTSHTYEIGDYNSFNSAYYFKADGTLYMISSGLNSYFNYNEDALLILDKIPSSAWTDVNYITSITLMSAEESNVVSDTEGKEALAGLVGEVSLDTCADYYADESERTAYGLDSGVSVGVKYKEAVTSTDDAGNQNTNYLDTTYTLLVGNKTDDGYYVSPAKSNIVYLVDAETVDAVLAYMTYVPATDDTTAE